jgi:site-specific DNA-methyltransferase (adenine-specific)
VSDRCARLLHGDCVELMGQLQAWSIDAIVTDPPYDLTSVSRGGSARQFVDNPYGRTRVGTDRRGFMGKTWDGTGVAFRVETWQAALRVLKPGGHLLAFGGTRTYHRMVCSIEDAGFEIRDSIIWLYGSGFPKSTRVDAPGFDGWGTGLKPAHETVVLARRPLSEPSVATNVERHGAGAINIDGCRVHTAGSEARQYSVRHNPGARVYAGEGWRPQREYQGQTSAGRWPANVVLSHAPTCRLRGTRRIRAITGTINGSWRRGKQYNGGWQGAPAEHLGEPIGYGTGGIEVIEAWECAPGCPVAELDGQSGSGRSRRGAARAAEHAGTAFRMTRSGTEHDDAGGASRFFYVAKASTRERNRGVEDEGNDADHQQRNDHPTVKPVALMRYLCRLITPPAGVVLDPFSGSGSTGVAAILEGFRFIGMELDHDYLAIGRRRIRHALNSRQAELDDAEVGQVA